MILFVFPASCECSRASPQFVSSICENEHEIVAKKESNVRLARLFGATVCEVNKVQTPIKEESDMKSTWKLSVIAAFALAAAAIAIPASADSNEAAVPAKPTFAKDIARIFQEKCEEFHRKGTAAPMSLATYQEVRPWAKAIRERVVTRNMPPWHIDKTVGIQSFQNDRSLTDQQINTIVHWVDSGAPLGDAKDLPPPKNWPDDQAWVLAKQ